MPTALWMDVEDSLALEGRRSEDTADGDTLDVAVIRLRWMSNFTDADALAAEPGVRVRFTVAGRRRARRPRRRARYQGDRRGPRPAARRRTRRRAHRPRRRGPADPGDLRRIPDARRAHRGRGRVTARAPSRASDCCPSTTRFAREKVLRRRSGRSPLLATAARRLRDPPRPRRAPGRRAAARRRRRRARRLRRGLGARDLLARRARARRVSPRAAGPRGSRPRPALHARERRVRRAREARLDVLGDLIAEHLDTDRLTALIEDGVSSPLPAVESDLRAWDAR